jgi:hypothetical protein
MTLKTGDRVAFESPFPPLDIPEGGFAYALPEPVIQSADELRAELAEQSRRCAEAFAARNADMHCRMTMVLERWLSPDLAGAAAAILIEAGWHDDD